MIFFNGRWRYSRFFFRGLLVFLTVWLGTSALVVHHLTRRARPPYAEVLPPAEGQNLETVQLTSEDGQRIGAWYRPGRPDRASLLLLHGNGGSRSGWLSLARELAPEGPSLLMITFRAHGDSTGAFNDIGYGGRLDVLAAVAWLEKRRPGRPIVVLGFSLGAAAALFAAERLGRRVAAYILDSPYPDLLTALDNRLKIYLPAPFDRLAHWGLRTVMPLFLPHWRRIAPERVIGRVPESIPILFLVGGGDRRATPADVRRLHRTVQHRAQWRLFPGAEHGRAYDSDRQRYRNSVLEWVELAEKGG